MTTVNKVITAALDFALSQNPNLFYGVSRVDLEQAMQTALLTAMPNELKLDTAKPDFESIYLRLVQELQADPVWNTIVISSVGQTLLRNISAGIAYSVYASERALQESFISSAFSENSIRTATRSLGVRSQRRIPASIEVKLTREDVGGIYTIPAFSKFNINNIAFFNRDAIVFNDFIVEVVATLHQGEIFELNAIADGVPFERIEIGSENGKMSDQDVYVFVGGEQWGRRTVGMFAFEPDEKVFYEDTLPSMNAEIQFGNGLYGAIPVFGTPIRIVWAETDGKEPYFYNNDLSVSLPSLPTDVKITGKTVSQMQAGSEALPVGFYKAMAPHVRASNRRAVRRSDYRAVALEYPNVVDAIFRGQAELNPGKRNWMNIVGATILTDLPSPWTTLQWNDFVSFMQERSIYQVEFLRMDPTPFILDIKAKIYCRPKATLDVLKNKLLADLAVAYSPRLNALGYSSYISDIIDLLEGKNEYEDEIEYVVMDTPKTDAILTGPTQYVKLNSVELEMHYTTRGGYTGRLDLIV